MAYNIGKCNDCGRNLDTRNTSGQATKVSIKTIRCGQCYLKFKAEQRKERGEQ